MSKATIIRLILSLLLLYGVYMETGVWTALCLFLVMMNIEINGALKSGSTSAMDLVEMVKGRTR